MNRVPPSRTSQRRPTAAGTGARPRQRDLRAATLGRSASQRLRQFRQGSRLAIALTGLLLLLWGPLDSVASGQDSPQVVDTAFDSAAATSASAAIIDTTEATPGRSVEEAAGTLRGLARDGWQILPKVGIALALILIAGGLARLLRLALRRAFGSWQKADAAAALGAVMIWLMALGAALSVLVGDVRALVGSVGLFGLALSWALQTPIESFTGWLLNSFRGYYRPGDRILVGAVFGDVQRIDFLTTTVWEAGGPDKPVQGAQPTGAMVTFPNAEILRSSVVNYTRDFPFVWDEFSISLAPVSDLRYAMEVLREVTDRVIGERMTEAADRYAAVLATWGLSEEVARRPEVYLSPGDSGTLLTLRYLVPVRERRAWLSRLMLAVAEAQADPRHAGRIVTSVRRVVLDSSPSPTGSG